MWTGVPMTTAKARTKPRWKALSQRRRKASAAISVDVQSTVARLRKARRRARWAVREGVEWKVPRESGREDEGAGARAKRSEPRVPCSKAAKVA